MRHVISLLVENESGVLARIVGLYAARGYNIDSLTVGPTEQPSLSRVTIVTYGTDAVIEQIKKQLNKLIDVITLIDLSGSAHVERALLLVKVRADTHDRQEAVARLVTIFRGNVVDVTDGCYTVQVVGDYEKNHAFLQAIPPDAVIETVSTGICGISRGKTALRLPDKSMKRG